MIIKKGITGFGNVPPIKKDEINSILKTIKYPYTYSNIIEPQPNTNYFTVDIQNKSNGINFKLLLNSIYTIIAGVTMESKWMELQFINLPEDFIEQMDNNEVIILNKEFLEKDMPEEELKLLDKNEIKQIQYWKSKKIWRNTI
jgi:hypothetical protein